MNLCELLQIIFRRKGENANLPHFHVDAEMLRENFYITVMQCDSHQKFYAQFWGSL
jgi:hypothetical protein